MTSGIATANGSDGDGEAGREGEEAIIQGAFAPLSAAFPGAFGLTDDAAVVSAPPGFDLVATTDAIAADVHFFANDPARSIGWKALAVNVSDLIAKGASPYAYLMAVAFPEAPAALWLTEFAAGLRDAQQSFGLHLAGGDTDRRPGPLAVTMTALGLVPVGGVVRRAGARPGDVVFVSGTLGDSALGLRLHPESARVPWQVTDADRDALVARYRYPAPPVALAPVLRGHVRAAMDISDGLVKDLGRMTRLAGTGAEIDLARIPLSAPARALVEAHPETLALVLSGGDDYQVLAAVAPTEAHAFAGAAAAAGHVVTAIGHITSESGVVIRSGDGRAVDLPVTGYDHF